MMMVISYSYFLATDQSSSLQSEINILKYWYDDSSLSINALKPKEDVFSKKQSNFKAAINRHQ